MATTHEDPLARETYRHVRLMLVTLPVLLLVGSVLAAVFLDLVETSISAYYLGPIRDIFVGVMVATAACLVVYRGSSEIEDYSLDVAGFYAAFVAVVPTGLAEGLAEQPAEERAEIVAALRVTAVAIIAVAAFFIAVERRTGHWSPKVLAQNRLTKLLFIATTVLAIAFLVLLTVGAVRGTFAGVHLAAAVLLVAGLAMAVASHGWPDPLDGAHPETGRARSTYRVIFVLMVLGAPLFGLLHWLGWEYKVVAVEWYEIALFAWFWFLETRRTWTPRPARAP